jgi:polysaccharide biosynthesis/export protein
MKCTSVSIKTFLCLCLLVFVFASCVNTRKAAYVENIKDTTIQSAFQDLEPVIQKNDLLSITVSSVNAEATQIFNMPNDNVQGSNSSVMNQARGYLVDQEGTINFPMLGKIKAAGFTKKNLVDNITKSLVDRKLLLDPIVSIRYLNYKVTVLGEVGHPSVISVPNERITVLEALGLAGDITVFGKKDNVLLVRELEGKKMVRRLDLNSQDLLTSPYYYLQSNDVIYVEPNKSKITSTGAARTWIPVAISALTFIVITVDKLFQN